jgi:hypothetical protein
MMTAGLLMNQFGLDRHGFRAVVLSPVPRRHILLGKNLAALVFCAPATAGLAVIGWIGLRLSTGEMALALLQLAALLLLACTAGNLVSILAPWRVETGSLKANKIPARVAFLNLLQQMLFPVLLAPIFLGPLAQWGWASSGAGPEVPVNLLVSAAVLALAAAAYGKTLAPLGRLLQRRERRILEVVTTEIE